MKNFRINRKGISPIFATLILIAIAVIAGVVVYAFTNGMLSGMTATSSAGQEKLAVQSSGFDDGASGVDDKITVYVQQTGGPAATINAMLIKDSSGNTVITLTGADLTGTLALPANTLEAITGTISGETPINGAAGELGVGQYTATVTTNAGGNFVSPSFTVAVTGT